MVEKTWDEPAKTRNKDFSHLMRLHDQCVEAGIKRALTFGLIIGSLVGVGLGLIMGELI